MTSRATDELTIEFAGEAFTVEPGAVFTVGRDGATNVYRLPETLPPLLGVPDALSRLGVLAYPGLGAVAWVLGGLLVLAGLARGPGLPHLGTRSPEATPGA